MTDFYHLMNARTPLDSVSQDMLMALGQDYRLSLPIEADPVPGISPVPQEVMLKNGIIGVYVTTEALSKPEMAPHTPWVGMPLTEWLERRIKL
jgi:hypothetical protein